MSRALPKLASTGIGSLPEMETAEALDWVFSLDIPYLPTFPRRSVSEEMLGQALHGLPGWGEQQDGSLYIKEALGTEEARVLADDLEDALVLKEYSLFQPEAPESAWGPFLARCAAREPRWAKIQLAGPLTVALVLEMGKDNTDELTALAFKLIRARSLAMAEVLHRLDVGVLFFWDEPMLSQVNLELGRHAEAWKQLSLGTRDLQEEGAVVGLHCCGQADFGPLMELPLDVLSFDNSLSLGSLLEDAERLEGWLNLGGTLALGTVPTRLPPHWDAAAAAAPLKKDFAQAFGKEGETYLRQCLLTPACGLGQRTVEEAEKVFDALKRLQGHLK